MNKTFSQFGKMGDSILKLKELPEDILSEPIKEGKWSIIQVVGHLYYWDKYNLEEMAPYMTEGADLPQFPDHDQHNEEAMAFIEDFSVASLIDRFVQTRKELTKELSKVGKGVRFTIGGGKRKFSSESFVKIFIKHDAHHLKQIHEKLQ
ncbi:DinB family protein [Salipaludibacillus agaradhaerens]|uniref:DinB family protein n=1 Tax=Salipaludibacillus agaradhaerens TaxID=76935 RepID=UPI00215127B4|nr:DinB family protein [Salipaludibacillus agaradhaerens]MCR6107775.1 DinB family protein [Salipaludibacillus agaradhaerens]MCR6119804.1 DinB family protein [Salipaludibacillus agaradhaerens]